MSLVDMADFDTLVSQYLSAYGVSDQKKAAVSATSANKIANMAAGPTPADFYRSAAGVYTGKGATSAGELETDLRSMSPLELSQKYGANAKELIAGQAQGLEVFRNDMTAQPYGGNWDAPISVASGFVNGIAGIGALATGGAEAIGLAPEGSGAYVASKIDDANKWVRSKQSYSLNARRNANAVIQSLDERDNAQTFEAEKAEDGEFIASLRRIGRDAMDAVGNTGSDPMLLADGVASGIGSLFGGGAIGKGLKAAGVAAKVAMPTAIAGLEAGSAYQQTADKALEMGASGENANKAGLQAAAIQAPVGLATGALVSKFEAAPLRVGSLASIPGNIARETVEEGIQSGSGQLAQNQGLQSYVDPNQVLSEGVGAQVGEGALFGMGTAGAVQTPGLAVKGVQVPITLAVNAGKAVLARGDRLIGSENTAAAQQATAAQEAAVAPILDPESNMEQELQAVIQEKGGERAPEMAEYLTQLFGKARFDPIEAQNEAPIIQAAVQGAQDRFTALRQAAQVANDPETSETERAQIGAYLLKQYADYHGLLREDLSDAIDQIEDEHPMLPKLREYADVVISLESHPEVLKALENSRKAVSSQEVKDQFTPEAMSTPEGLAAAQQMAEAVMEITTADPEQADVQLLNVIRAHATSGRLNLTTQQKQMLEAAYSLVKETEDILAQKSKLGLTYTDKVTHEIQTRDETDASQSVKMSGKEHAKGIIAALRVQDRDLARTRLQDFMLFAQHMQNKVDALNASFLSGKNEPYSALSTNREPGQPNWFVVSRGLGLKAYIEESVQFAQQTALDARAIAKLANGMAAAFPELAVQSVSPVSLGIDPKLERKAADIVREYQSAKKKDVADQVKPPKPTEETAENTTEDVAEPVEAATELDPNQQPLPFDKPVEPLKEPEQPLLPLGSEEGEAVQATQEDKQPAAEAVPVEETAEAAEVSEETQAEPEKDRFENLLGASKGQNWFKKAFRFPKEARTRLLGLGDQTIATVRDALSSAENLEAFLGQKTRGVLTEAVATGYADILDALPGLQKAMEARLQEYVSTHKIEQPEDVRQAQEWVEGRALNIAEQADGVFSYNPELLQTALLAGLQWFVNTQIRPVRELDAEAVGEILGLAPTELPEGAVTFFNEGVWATDAKRSLAEMIQRFWGVTANNDAPLGYAKGIPEAVAAEILKSFEAVGLIEIVQATFEGGDTPKKINRVQLSKHENVVAAVTAVKAMPSAIEMVVLVEPEEVRFIGKPPKKVAEFQMRNQLVKNTPQDIAAIRAEQNTPHFLNTEMVGFFESLGKDLTLELLGAGKLDPTRYNKNHLASLKGQNATIGGAYDALVGMLAEVRNKASQDGVDPSQMPIHYAYNVSRVGRLHMLGLHNPQSSKLMREVVLPTRSTMDMTKSANKAKFMLAMAQAWGVKVHKQPRMLSVMEAQKLASGQFAPAIEALGKHLDGKIEPKELVNVLKDSFGEKLSAAAIHAAMEYVRLQRSDNPSEFITDAYVEADGVTDGPINALVHISTGPFTTKWLKLVAKGGLFFGQPGMTMNAFVAQGGDNAVDLYEHSTGLFRNIMKDFRESQKDPGLEYLMNTLLLTMNTVLGDDVQFDGKNLIIERGIAKNPLTVTIYGSGAKGIANKVAGTMLEGFYEELSKKVQNLNDHKADELMDAMETLTNVVVGRGEKGLYWKDNSRKTKGPRGESADKFTLSPDQVKNLQQNVMNLFVTPLREAIESTIQDTATGREAMRDAVQVQSIFLQHVFQQKVEAKIQEKMAADPNFRHADFLSQNELNAIYKELVALSPLIETGTQSFFIAGSEKSDIKVSRTVDPKTGEVRESDYVFSRSFSDDLSSPAYIYGPVQAGVAGIPFMVIGPGDGQMMQNLATMPDAPEGTLKVFDGVHTKLDTLEEDNRKTNQAVYEGWLRNPMTAVNVSFQKFLENVSFKDMSAEQIEDLKKSLFAPKEREKVTVKDIEARIRLLGADLQSITEDTEKRHAVLAKVAMSVDHMASAEAPYQADGISLEGLTLAEIATRLNELMNAPPEEKAVANQTTTVDEAPATPEPSVVVEAAQQTAKRMARSAIPAELKNLLREALRALGSDWEIVQGTQDQTTAYALSKGEVPYLGKRGEQVKGYTSPAQKRVYVNVPEAETLLHEVLHATTTQKILEHYHGKTNPEVSEAISQLETLMGQWLALNEDLSGLTMEQRRAYKDAYRVVMAEAHNGERTAAENKAAALDEFLAWNLSNQDLIRIAQGTKVENPLARVVKRVLISLKNLIWGRKMAPMVRSDMYSALRFNASVLINSTPTLQMRSARVIRQQSVAYGNNQRLTDLQLKLEAKIHAFLKSLPVGDGDVLTPKLTKMANAVYAAFDQNGFRMSPQEMSTFNSLLSVFAVQGVLDQSALNRVQELYTHVNKTLTVEDFMDDPTSTNPANRYLAARKLSVLKGIDYVTGAPIIQMDTFGRTSLMSAFLALAVTNDGFREVLSKMPLPKSEKLKNDSLDNILLNAGNGVMDTLARTLSGEKRNSSNIREAIDALTNRLAENVEAQENLFSQIVSPIAKVVDGLNDKTVSVMQTKSREFIDKLTTAQTQTNSKAVKGVLAVGKAIAAVVNEQQAAILAEGWISTANQLKVYRPAHEFLNDLIGRTESNAPVYDMIKRVRTMVQQIRQQFREHLPGLIAQRFSRDLTDREWSHLFKGLAKTDLMALRQAHTFEQILEMLKDPAVYKTEVRRLEELIKTEAGSNWPLIEQKAQQLAKFMNTGIPGYHLLRNADAVAHLYGVKGATTFAPSRALIERVDRLVSLYALDSLDASVKSTLTSLVQSEADGMQFVMAYLAGQRKAEQDKLTTPRAQANHYKGYIPSEAQAGAQLIIAEDTEAARLRIQGYQRIGPYEGSSLEFGSTKRSYFYAPLSSRALFNQGIMQNVRQTASGVDPVTGYTHGGVMTAGRILSPVKVAKIANKTVTEKGDALLPVFDKGVVIAYERSVDPNQVARLNKSEHLVRMIGVWRGRQAEESLAGEYNRLLIDNLYEIWERDKKKGRQLEYVNLFKTKDLDPVTADAVSLFTPEALEYIREVFGGDGFMVRKDMLNDTIGYRAPSVGDAWTGNTRLPPQAADLAKRIAVGVFGVDAYKYLVTAEKLLQNLVSDIRQLIVVKSVIVPVSNLIANVYQMMSQGISPVRIARDMPKKLAETNAYVQRRQRQIELEAMQRAAVDNVSELRKINAELLSIHDANKRMSIWPLIEAGEFSSISDAGSLQKEETTLFEGKLSQYIEQQVNKLPAGVRTAGRYALITQDTALFHGMRRAMEYGDFLAKALTYDHLTQNKKYTQEKALARVTENFVNYDRLSGRFRQGMENLGLLWFWNFKIRIAKIAVATIRENPVHALLSSLVPTPDFVGSIGTPLSDNLFAVGLEGDLGWSVGPGMGLRSYEMNPWLSLVN